ncbi:MAG: serine/threonine-protein phosphatase [Spirulina sp. SIO3F2]|nr:serine/threonine-protein phosphatase [Spirulina sp. SIO3F2]
MARSPLSVHPYLWAIGPIAAKLTPPNVIVNRYQIRAPQIWQDLYPYDLPDFPESLPPEVLPYLRLYPQRYHVPEVYGICTVDDSDVVLLTNAPLTAQGELLPSLESQWLDASPLRQAYWLWQILELWSHLQREGVATSVLVADNLRVEGGRLRLIELLSDRQPLTNLSPLVKLWLRLARHAHYSIAATLENIVAMLQQPEPSPTMIRRSLNHLLLEQAAQLPLSVQVASATDPGSEQLRNEDAIYPPAGNTAVDPRVLVVCDGIGGHAEGAIASQSAVQSLQLQGQALISELQADPLRLEPEMVADQLTALIRISNNLIANRNDQQNRSARQRMATTTVMALQLPQIIETPENRGTSHELYLLHIGDSRAYWITENYCHCLTVDHDIIRREVCKGEAMPLQARQRPDAGALTQALGTRGADRLHPTIQRFVIEENGILLLCSDGLSDRYLLERCWTDFAPEVLRGTMTLSVAVEYLVRLARQHNGHDNISVVAALYNVQNVVLPTASVVDSPPAELMPTLAELELQQLANEPSEDGQLEVSTIADSNGTHQTPSFLESEPTVPPTFKNLEDVENLLLELTQAEPSSEFKPSESQPEISPPSSSVPSAKSETDAPSAAQMPEPIAPPESSTPAPTPAPTEASDMAAPLPPLPKPNAPNNSDDSGQASDAYTPNNALPDMVPTWDNPNPWAAASKPPYGPGSEPDGSDEDAPELPSSLFENMDMDDLELTSAPGSRWNWLWVVGILGVVAIVSAIVLVMRSQFATEREPEPERTEQQERSQDEE